MASSWFLTKHKVNFCVISFFSFILGTSGLNGDNAWGTLFQSFVINLMFQNPYLWPTQIWPRMDRLNCFCKVIDVWQWQWYALLSFDVIYEWYFKFHWFYPMQQKLCTELMSLTQLVTREGAKLSNIRNISRVEPTWHRQCWQYVWGSYISYMDMFGNTHYILEIWNEKVYSDDSMNINFICKLY